MSEPIISDGRADTRQAASAHCTLRPGERTIGGRVFYSAAWLSPQPERSSPGRRLIACLLRQVDRTKGGTMHEDLDENTDALSFRIADGVSDLLRSLGSKVGPAGSPRR